MQLLVWADSFQRENSWRVQARNIHNWAKSAIDSKYNLLRFGDNKQWKNTCRWGWNGVYIHIARTAFDCFCTHRTHYEWI